MAKRPPRACPAARRVEGLVSGQRAKSRVGSSVLSHTVGAIPLLMRIMDRMQLEPLLRQHVPDKDARTKGCHGPRLDCLGVQPARLA